MGKASTNEKIKLLHNVVYGSSYGLVQIPKGTVLTVSERLQTDDGVITEETVTLKSEIGEVTFQYTIWDAAYEIVY